MLVSRFIAPKLFTRKWNLAQTLPVDPKQPHEIRITIKALLGSRGAYLILDTPEGGLFKNLDEEDIYDSFISLLTHILRIQDAILRVKYINSTDFYPKLYQN